MSRNLYPMFFPNSVGIIGASPNLKKHNGAFVERAIKYGYPKESIYLVNPKYAGAGAEIFGPVVCLIKFPRQETKRKTVESAAKIINNKKYGLSNAILTNDAGLRYYAGKLVKTGIFYRGRGTTGAELGQYFGGVGLSGWGREDRGIESFTYIKQIYDDYYPEVRLAQLGAADKLREMLKNSKPLF